jgi:hypothetical protein
MLLVKVIKVIGHSEVYLTQIVFSFKIDELHETNPGGHSPD